MEILWVISKIGTDLVRHDNTPFVGRADAGPFGHAVGPTQEKKSPQRNFSLGKRGLAGFGQLDGILRSSRHTRTSRRAATRWIKEKQGSDRRRKKPKAFHRLDLILIPERRGSEASSK
jgi:hypothetical protein